MTKVFISYRRSDSQWQTKQLYDVLSQSIVEPKKNIFYDLDSMLVGFDFRQRIDDAVAKCDVLIAVMGNRWLTEIDPDTGHRRLDNPNDLVRLEIAAALSRNIQVVPVLVDGTVMPKAEELPEDLRGLSFRHGVKLRVDSYESDMSALLRGLNLGERPAESAPVLEAPTKPRFDHKNYVFISHPNPNPRQIPEARSRRSPDVIVPGAPTRLRY